MRPSFLGASAAIALAASLLSTLATSLEGCGGDVPDLPGAGGASAGQSTSAVGGGTGAGGEQFGGCKSACDAGTFCSAAGTCIPDGTCADDADCGEGLACNLGSTACEPGGGCAQTELAIAPIAPNVLLVLDRSCSMTAMVGNVAKWQLAVDALVKLTTDFDGKIRFGLTLFPDTVTPDCTQDKIPIPVGEDNETAIQELLTKALGASDPLYPSGPCVTNIDTAMTQAAAAPELVDATRDNYAVLISDGGQAGCSAGGGDAGTEKTIAGMLAAKVATFVLGFGAAIDAKALGAFALAGGVPTGDALKPFYDVQDAASLAAALDTIAKKTIGCSYVLDTPPEGNADIFVFFDNVTPGVPQDPTHMSGWDYDAQTATLTFYGEQCDQLKSGTVTDVDIVIGCEAPTPD